MKTTTVVVRDARPEDAAGIVAILNPIIAAGVYTVIDGPVTIDGGQYIDETIIEKFLT